MEFVEVKTTGNECGLQKEAIQATPPGSGVGAVPLDATEGTLGLNGAVHTQKSAVDAVKIVQNLLVEMGQFLNRNRAEEKEFFVVWTEQISIFVYSEVDSTIRVVLVVFVAGFFLIHGEFHVFFHSLFFTKEIVVVAAISGVAHGILRIEAIILIEPLHKGLKTVHV